MLSLYVFHNNNIEKAIEAIFERFTNKQAKE